MIADAVTERRALRGGGGCSVDDLREKPAKEFGKLSVARRTVGGIIHEASLGRFASV
jgi:hypothetical protein